MIRINGADESYIIGDKMARSLHRYREAKITPAMWIVGTIMIIIMSIICFIITYVPPLA